MATDFAALALSEPLLRAVAAQGYEQPTPIQVQAIPHVLEGHDLLGCARTGTGKTASFALPMLQRLAAGPRVAPRTVRALVLVPTRELAAQVAASFETYGRGLKLSVALVYGGVSQNPQVRALDRGVDVLVATPGRLVDLMGQGHAHLGKVGILVLDEADHMLDLGFLPDVKRILAALPARRQTLLFSATMPPEIATLADRILVRPVKVFVTPAATTVEAVEQRVHMVDRSRKTALMVKLLGDRAVGRALVFTRTKRGSDKLARSLTQSGIPALAIHGNKSQNVRERTLAGFRSGKTRVLVATDIAARGIDVDGITHVFNFELPNVPETYVHRIGRTARAGASGVAVSLCGGDERDLLRDIERLIRGRIEIAPAVPGLAAEAPASASHASRARSGAQQRGNRSGVRGHGSKAFVRPAGSGAPRGSHGRKAPRHGTAPVRAGTHARPHPPATRSSDWASGL